MNNTLIIEIPYAGLGDHLFHSHLPKIAKMYGSFEKVYISNNSPVRNKDYKKLVWEYNPYIDGFVDTPGMKCDLSLLVQKVKKNSTINLLDEVMYAFGLNNGLTYNQPEIYYQPKFRQEFNHIIYDPNFISWIGNITEEDADLYFKRKKISFDIVMKLRGNQVMFKPNANTKFIETPTLEDFCDLIYSCKKLYCLTSGTATISAALSKSATVFYGNGQPDGFRHYDKHDYQMIPRYILNRVRRKLKNMTK